MNGFGPFLHGKLAFILYWFLFGLLMLIVAYLYWKRGREDAFGIRTKLALQRFVSVRSVTMLLSILWLGCCGWLYYDTKVVNTYTTEKEQERLLVEYEQRYKRYEHRLQPRVVSLDYDIELYPEQRSLCVQCTQVMANKGMHPIDTLFFTLSPSYTAAIDIPGSTSVLMDTVRRFAMYRLKTPLQPGDSMEVRMSMNYRPRGIENEVSRTFIVENGTFFNNADILPLVGYQPGYEMSDRNDRKKYGLPLRERMPRLSQAPDARMNTYLTNNSDWVRVRSRLGTSGDQIAIAPGSLRRSWQTGGRRYFAYELDHPSMNFYSFMSARYEVRTREHKGVRLEVYFDKRHAYNVD
ncbi:MAG: hypothetical protein ACKOB6_09025, partial [Candidatus Kapaibacterium sp.]